MPEIDLFLRLGVSILLGILIGLQREFVSGEQDRDIAAGIRTFPLLALTGCVAAHVSASFGSAWPFSMLLLIVGTFFTVNYFVEAGEGNKGLTTDVAALLTVLIGAMAYQGRLTLAVAVAVACTVLLSGKKELHGFVESLTDSDIHAALKFAVISAVILPVLPDRSFGIPPVEVFNPFRIWLFVVIVSGIGFVGYLLNKLVGERRGLGIMGLLGGLASSTALTYGLTLRSLKNTAASRAFVSAILIAWTVMYARLLIVVAALNLGLFRAIVLPVGVVILAGMFYGLATVFIHRNPGKDEPVELSNPFELWPAVKFGMVFTVVLMISKGAQEILGKTGLYFSSFVAGLADVDAIALSVAELSHKSAEIPVSVAGRAVILAALANTLSKGMIVVILGAPALKKAILPGFTVMTAAGMVAWFLV
jgi:uncharacterized membrane protein (DUF4010 family)